MDKNTQLIIIGVVALIALLVIIYMIIGGSGQETNLAGQGFIWSD